jgi:tetratricopeptide (TPR) repeat protein
MPATDSNLDAIFIPRDAQEQHFRNLLLHWKYLAQATSTTSTVVGTQPVKSPSTSQDCQPPSPRHKIQGPVILLFGGSGLGKSTLLKRYHKIASEAAYRLRVANIIDWRTTGEVDSRRFAVSFRLVAPLSQETDPLLYFNLLHRKLAEALSRRPADAKKQLAAFEAYKQAVAEVRAARELVSHIVFRLHIDKEKYEPLGWLKETKTGTQKLMRWCFERAWPACNEAQIREVLIKYIGEGTGIEKKHLSGLREALQNHLSAEELEIYLYPERILACGMGHDLRSQAKRRALILFFDTYEYMARGDSWLRHVMSAAGQRVGWVIAGQASDWSRSVQPYVDSDNYQLRYSYQDIVAEDRLLSIDFAFSNVGTFSVRDITYYFAQLCTQQPELKSISRTEARRIFDITQGNPQVVNNIASSYAYRPDLNSILKKAEHHMLELYFANTQNDEQERQKLYGLAMLRRANNAGVVTSIPGLDQQRDKHTYEQLLQQLHNRYHFIAIEQGQPLLHEMVRANLRNWLLTEGRKMTDFPVVARCLVEAQQSQLQELELQHHYSSLRDYFEDDNWINTYLDFIEASFWADAGTGILQAVALMLAAMLYRPDIMNEIERLSLFFINVVPAPYCDLWQRLIQSLLAKDQRMVTDDALLEGLADLHNQLAQMITSPHLVSSCGQGIDYECGLVYLKQHISDTALQRELSVYEFQLRENLTREHQYGLTEQIQASRVKIVDQLNSLAEKYSHASFIDLCRTPAGFPAAYVRELEGALWWLQGKIHREYAKNDPSAALIYYQEAFKRLSDHSALQEDFARIYWKIAADHFNERQYQQCIACLDAALQIKYDYEDAYYSRGNALYELGRYDEAIVQYQYVICLYEQYLPAFINLGNVYADLKRYEDAQAAYDRACELDPQNYLSYYNRGCTYKELKKYHEALQDFIQTIELKADYAEAYIGRGNVYGILHNYQNARADYQKAAEIDPRAINNIWMATWASFGKTVIGNEAQQQLEKLIQLDAQHYIAYICRAMCMALQHQKLNHIEPVLKQAKLQEPEQWDTYFWKGIILAFCGQTEAARKEINQALELGLPPLLLMPLYWLEHVVPNFFNTYARPLLKKHSLLEQNDP